MEIRDLKPNYIKGTFCFLAPPPTDAVQKNQISFKIAPITLLMRILRGARHDEFNSSCQLPHVVAPTTPGRMALCKAFLTVEEDLASGPFAPLAGRGDGTLQSHTLHTDSETSLHV